MALFLSESADVQLQNVTLHEAYQEFHDVVVEGYQLQEAILTADFILHEQSKTLTESEVLDKSKDFLKNTWAKFKEWCMKMWARIKQFVYAVSQRVKGWFGKAEIKSDQQYVVNKFAFEQIPAVVRLGSRVANVTAGNIEDARKGFENELASLKAKGSEKNQKTMVSGAKILNLESQILGELKKMDGSVNALKQAVNEAEKAVKNADEKDKEAASKALKDARELHTFVARGVSKVSTMALGVLTGLRPTLQAKSAKQVSDYNNNH